MVSSGKKRGGGSFRSTSGWNIYINNASFMWKKQSGCFLSVAKIPQQPLKLCSVLPVEVGWQFRWQKRQFGVKILAISEQPGFTVREEQICFPCKWEVGPFPELWNKRQGRKVSLHTWSVSKDGKLMSIHEERHGVTFTLFPKLLFRFCSLSRKLVGCCD